MNTHPANKTACESDGTGSRTMGAGRAPSATMVIFGAGGDLTKRLIIPALNNLAKDGALPDDFRVIGLDRSDRSTSNWRDELTNMWRQSPDAGNVENSGSWPWLMERLDYLQGDFTAKETFQKLDNCLKRDGARETNNVLFYLAIAEKFFGPVIEQIAAAGLTKQSEKSWRRIIIEKPFGHDLNSAKSLNQNIKKLLSEDQIYRIDHFVGKETVQNILVMRFANGIFEPMWTREHIDHVQITAAEIVGVETRGQFYEKIGALRDMVPNHLFQLLAMIAMEPPISFDADSVRARKTELFKAIRPVAPNEAVRGQYGAGQIDGHELREYKLEKDVSPDSTTETYVALKLEIENWRWAGVPFYLRTGKHLPAHTTEILVYFRQAPFALFRDTPIERLPSNILTLRLEPNEGLSTSFSAKRPGRTIEIEGVKMSFSYRDFFPPLAANGYETLIYDSLIGDATLFQRDDTVDAAWAAVQPLLESWAKAPDADLAVYPSGSEGPDSADRLIERDGRAWAPIKT